MSRRIAICVIAALVGIVVGTQRGEGAKPVVRGVPAQDADVLRVLREEVAGSVDRRAALKDVLQARKESSVAHWQAGFVRNRDDWRSVSEDFLATEDLAQVEQYREQRAAAPQTALGQLQLADWCRKQGLVDQERAHLQASLALEQGGDPTPVLERLGYRQIGGQWLSPEQLQEWSALNQQTQHSLQRWGAKLEKIAKQLAGGVRQREAGRTALLSLNDPSVIPAMELTLSGRDEAVALVAVEAMARLEGYEATIALAKQGMFSNWPKVREAAAVALKGRSYEDYVPQLVALLSTPIESRVDVQFFGAVPTRVAGEPRTSRVRAVSGALIYSFIIQRETGDQFQRGTFQTFNSLLDDYLTQTPVTTRDSGRIGVTNGLSVATAAERGRTDSIRAFQDDVHRKERRVEQWNESITETNQRVGELLAVTTGKTVSAKPQDWWSWWNQYADMAVNKRAVQVVGETETVGNLAPTVLPGSGCECLVAGTLIRTDTGLRPIEEIRVGDRVLAKNIETGELAYKAVLETTLRQPKELHTLRFDDETVVCTGGHRFWISGTGWVKARDIAPASLVHTATGNTPIWSTKKGKTAETYNLVVADFHTYFVGKSAVLCQDVTLPRPSNKVVPGLDRAQVVATAE